MTIQTIFTGQGITKDSVVGNRLMNRYGIFNGLERPRRVDSNLLVTVLGVDAAADPTAVGNVGPGNVVPNWYAYKAVYASATYTRPVPVADGSGNFTRGNPSVGQGTINLMANAEVRVSVPASTQAGITHILLYRSLGAGDEATAITGPYFYVAQALNTTGTVFVYDNVADGNVGIEVETDNFSAPSHRYAIEADSYIFAAGNLPIGNGLTCILTPGSSVVTVDAGVPFYDGIRGWRFKAIEDSTGGTNEGGLYFANFVSSTELALIDGNGDSINYNGGLSGAGQTFITYIPGYVLRWCKKGEMEAWPINNLINFEGDITGIAQIPNQTLLLVCTDEPSMWILDLTVIGTDIFKTSKLLMSTEHTVSSHYSLVPVDSRLRGIDWHSKAIIETDGTSVLDISSPFVPKVFDSLTDDFNQIKLWHCAYDKAQHLFGAFVTFQNSARLIDFCIGQFTLTGGWFFNHEKDLLSTGNYQHPDTGEFMVLGGTEGPGNDDGGVWGRIWTPNVYSEWIPSASLLSGTITSAVDAQNIIVDNSTTDLYTGPGGLIGRWVLVSDSNGEFAQLGYISSNTANQLTIDRVVNSLNPDQFFPVPEQGWKFYLGLIEMRWGPKRYDFGDPDVKKKVRELWSTVQDHNEDDVPFMRLYRGFEVAYAEQLALSERLYLDSTTNQSFVNKTSNKLEQVPRWGVSFYDRSYGPTVLHSITIVFRPAQDLVTRG